MIELTGDDELKRSLSGLSLTMNNFIDQAVFITAVKVQQNAIKSIRVPSFSGDSVKRGKKRHQISAKGQAPNTDTGRLIGSIVTDHRKGSKVAFVGTNLDYGLFLETSKNRPWLEPAREAEIKNFSLTLKKAILSAVKKAAK